MIGRTNVASSGSSVVLPNVTDFTAVNQSSGTEILLTWTNSTEPSFLSNEIYMSTNDISNYTRDYCIANAILLYDGTDETYTHTGVSIGTRYYYKVFSKYDIIDIKYSGGISVNLLCENTTPPSAVTNLSATASDQSITLKWTDSVETDWSGTMVRRKIGSYPTSITDGDLVVNSTSKNQYSSTGYVDSGLNNGTAYYYKLFPYNSGGYYNITTGANEVTATPNTIVVYGMRIDETNENPETSVIYTDDAVGMTGGSSDWDSRFPYNAVKVCLLKNGVVQYYLNPNDSTKKIDGTASNITSGADGDVMIQIPKMAYLIYREGNYLYVKITNNPNAKSVDLRYGFYAHTRDTEGDRDNLYVGAYLGYSDGTKLRSLSGKIPTASKTISQFRTLAQANGTGYDLLTFYPLTLLQCLYAIRYKNLDSQTALGRGFVDGNSSTIATGGTNTKGMYFGETTGQQQMKFMGIEDFWGNLSYWIDGLYSNASWHILTAFKSFNDTGSGYTDRGQAATANLTGYISKSQGTTNTGFIAKECSGSSSTYYADYAALYAGRLPRFGGNRNDASSTGAFMLSVGYSASSYGSDIGARLMYL